MSIFPRIAAVVPFECITPRFDTGVELWRLPRFTIPTSVRYVTPAGGKSTSDVRLNTHEDRRHDAQGPDEPGGCGRFFHAPEDGSLRSRCGSPTVQPRELAV